MTKNPLKVGARLRQVVTSDDLDLWLLAVAAAVFTVLGIVGLVSSTILSSGVLALLAVMAVAQMRSRREIALIATSQRIRPTDFLLEGFPEELAYRREQARDVLIIGRTLARTIQTYRGPLQRSLGTGARVRVMVLDPTTYEFQNHRTAALTRPISPGSLRRLENSLVELEDIQRSTGGDLQIKIAPFWPTIGVNALDVDTRDGVVAVQHYEFEGEGEPLPIMVLRSSDGQWFKHYVAEAERMWAAGIKWPLTPSQKLRTQAAPAFIESFGQAPFEAISLAGDILISGVARNTLFMENYRIFQAALRRGAQIRVVLLAPDSDAVEVAADRYYAERSTQTLRNRISHTSKLIESLAQETLGAIELRFTQHPIASGVIAVNVETSHDQTLFCEYYTYRALGEPKFVLRPSDGAAYDSLLGEAELLWRGGHVAISSPNSTVGPD